MIPEEVYVISHHVHHAKSDMPGDPYNATGGFLYCFLADVNHQLINRNMSREDYSRVADFLSHTGVKCNTYEKYQRWGSVSDPVYTILGIVLNLTFWFSVFYLIGGMVMASTLFGGAFFWAVGVRTFNYKGHGKGKDTKEEGKVVVEITVDKNGKTISAQPGIKGTTNTAKCLLDQAKIAAMNTRWSADENAAEQQVGKIEYNFRLN